MISPRCWLTSLLLLVLSPYLLIADEQPAAILSTESAGADFQVQGEYLGLVGHVLKAGAQVIAKGKGHFEGVFYRGGLPGDGWDGATRFAFRGKTQDGQTRFVGVHGERLAFENPNFAAIHHPDRLIGQAKMFLNATPDVSFVLRKVHRKSPTLGAQPPDDAIVLFDGSSASEWLNGRVVEERLLACGTTSRSKFNDHFLHLEFRCPFMPEASGMGRGNSGVYLQSRWEVQIVDSFGWNRDNRKFERLSALGRCGAVAEMIAPRINMSLPPLVWQTFDIEFKAARFEPSGKRAAPAELTVLHNGVKVHDRLILPPDPPDESRPPPRDAPGLPGALFLQDHGDPVHFRNIWVVER